MAVEEAGSPQKQTMTQAEIDAGLVEVERKEREGQAMAEVKMEKAKESSGEEALPQEQNKGLVDATQAGKTPQRIVANYDFKHPARVNKDQLRTLENLHDNFARLLSSTFSGAMRAVVDVDMAFVDQTTYREFIMSLSNPAMSYQFTLGPTKGQAIIDVAMPLVFSFVDRIFGGKGSSQGVDARQVTPIEIGVINRIIKRVIEDLEATWAPILPVEVYDIELETNPEFMQITAASEIVILLAFEVNSTNASGLVSLCYPFFTLESILPGLGQQSYVSGWEKGMANPPDEKMRRRDELKRRRLGFSPSPAKEKMEEHLLANRLRLGKMKVEAVAELGRTRIGLDEARGLRAGDVVRLPTREGDPVAVYLGGKPKFLARPFAAEDGELKLKVVDRVPVDLRRRYGTVATGDEETGPAGAVRERWEEGLGEAADETAGTGERSEKERKDGAVQGDKETAGEQPRAAQKVPIHEQIRAEIRSLTNLPAMPGVHGKLLTLLSKPDEEVDMNLVSRTLELDPALSTRVMRVCKSAYFGFPGNLMKQAVAFLGVAEVRKIVQSAVIYQIFDEDGEGDRRLTVADLWTHSLAVGLAMEIVGKADKKKTHFLLGVLHDIGKAVFMFRFPDHFSSVLDRVEKENVSVLQAEQELLGITHADCGGELAVHWDLPGEVRTAIASHHSPASTTQHRRLAAMVHIADIAVRTMEIGYAGDPLIPEMDPYARRMQKSVEEITNREEEIRGQVEAILGE